ncbi:MAG: cytochrome b/b6 domain-containing protein [Paracoccaceae bacterium]
MAIANTNNSYGSIARILHWLTALLILTAIALSFIIDALPRQSAAEVQQLFLVYSLHKTTGIAAFFTAIARILWAISQPRPAPIHAERRLETFAAEAVHWSLYLAMLVMPISGWLGHSAVSGYAPILWPFGQSLPFVPQSETLEKMFFSVHGAAAKLLYLSLALHVAGALKHALIDRDATLTRMISGKGPTLAPHRPAALPFLVAGAGWAAIIALGLILAPEPEAEVPATGESAAEVTGAAIPAGNWAVSTGTLTFTVTQAQSPLVGHFADWTATINYDEATRSGAVSVLIPLSGMTIGSVTKQAAGPEFFDIANHPTATFTSTIADVDGQLVADGTLNLHGTDIPVKLPFDLTITGDKATMTGQVHLDRRDFGIGIKYADETTVGFAVVIDVGLEAKRTRAAE